MNKGIFLDIDGTLVDYANNLPPSAIEAIELAQKKGNHIYLCTGRTRSERCEELMELTNADGLICANGAYVEKNGEVIFNKTLPSQLCREVMDYLDEMKLAYYAETNDDAYASANFIAQAGPYIASYMGVEYTDNTDTKELFSVFFPDMHYGENIPIDGLIKISYTMTSRYVQNDMKNRFPQLKHGTWGGPTEALTFGDVGDKDISKADGIDVIISTGECSLENTIAFGDAEYDIPMFRHCSIGVAMGNGDDAVKKAADYVTDDVGNDGLYKAFLHFDLI